MKQDPYRKEQTENETMASKYVKGLSVSLVIMEMQIYNKNRLFYKELKGRFGRMALKHVKYHI